MTLIILALITAAVATWLILRKKKKQPAGHQNSDGTTIGYRIQFFKQNKEVDSKIIH